MSRFVLVVNNDIRLDNGEEDTLESVESEVYELLRSGYFEVESVIQITD